MWELLCFFPLWHGGENIKQTKGDKTTYVFKMATIAPEQLGWAALIRDIVNPGIDKATNGRVVLDRYYGGRMGDDPDILAKMINGQLQGADFPDMGW